MPDVIRIGTRGSDLARWQATHVSGLLREHYPDTQVEIVIFSTKGDEILDKPLPSIGGKGLFTAELERALLDGDIDCAVHSLKDLPTENPPGLVVGAIPERAPAGDVLISRDGHTLDDLPQDAVIATSSLRRASQVRFHRADFQIKDIRGNVPTRISKVHAEDSPYDAMILAQAGVERLQLTHHVAEVLPSEVMLPAPGQGALGIQCRDDADSRARFDPLNHLPTRHAVTAERTFLNVLGGGCAVPVAAYATLEGDTITLIGRVGKPDGSTLIEVRATGTDPDVLGRELADDARAQGAMAILEEIRE